VPAANVNGAISLDYKVQDNGGTASGGQDTSTGSATLTLNVRAVNDAPDLSMREYAHGLSPQFIDDARQVNTFTPGKQENPAVTALTDGGYVIVWMSKGQDGGDNSFGIFGQRYDAAGQKAGEEFQINDTVANDQFAPVVRALPPSYGLGSFAVVWSSL